MKKGIILFFICFFYPCLYFAALTPEEESLKFQKILKPITDEAWKALAGDKTSETYEIIKGDTLWSISNRLFGDPKVWPKIWALNNHTITNPHVITPKNLIAFLPGSGSSLPSVAIQESPFLSSQNVSIQAPPPRHFSQAPLPRGHTRSQEWKLLQPQTWESVQTHLPQQVDPDGFDRRSKISFNVSTGFELFSLVSTEPQHILGELVASRSAGKFLSLGDIVYIDSEEKLNSGERYAITPRSSTSLSSSGRGGYAYPISGKVLILRGFEEGLFVGRIVAGSFTIQRGDRLIPLPPRIKNIKPIAGPEPLVGNILVDKALSTIVVAQHKQVIIDRGSEDGVQTGMIFRVYQYQDPSTKKKITDQDLIVNADIIIAQVSELFSVGLMIRGQDIFNQGTEAVLLTDVSDLIKRREFRESSFSPQSSGSKDELLAPPEEELPTPPEEETQLGDELDQLDQPGELTPEEEQELQQLEQFKSEATEESQTVPDSAPETAPAPVESPEGSPQGDSEESPAEPPSASQPEEVPDL
jgi:hypothetical protein